MSTTLKYAFRITHIDNIPHVLRCGLVRADSPLRTDDFISIGDPQIIQVRGEREVKGYRINEFIPFYLGPRSPMLYVIQHGYNGVQRVDAENIVYLVVRLDELVSNDVDCIFTDGHALSSLTNYYTKDKLPIIDKIVRYDDVYSSRWDSDTDLDLKRRKEAELLIKNDLPVQFIKGFVVYNEQAKVKLMAMGVDPVKIAVRPEYYF